MSVPFLSIRDLHFAHGGHAVLQGVNLDLTTGETLVVVGPSGCGKTTLLRAIAGLDRPQKGAVTLEGALLSGGDTFIPAEHRSIGFVFQGLGLFPHLTVRQNIGFGLHRATRREREARVDQELASVGLNGLDYRYPHQLSGGQQQRVAIARSLVLRPRLMLMDEPFSDLDPHTRSNVRTEVMRILREHATPAIIVTHDREDAFHVADRIAEMDHGRIIRTDSAEVFRREWKQHPFEAEPSRSLQ